MTGQPPLDGRDESMDFSEGALKERLEAAVSGMSPDVRALMDGGMQRGVRLQRRRRVEVLGATGLSVAAAAAVVYAGITSGLFDSNSTGPTDTPRSVLQEINQPATARSLAAAALEHLPADQVIGAGSMGSSQRSTVFASVGLSNPKGKVQLDLLATSRLKQWDKQPPCASGTPSLRVVQCRVSRLDDGSQLILLAEKANAGPGPAKYLVSLGVRRETQVVAVLEYLVDGRATPRNDNQPVTSWAMPVSVDTMREIVTDPRFGVVTSPEMVAKGKAIVDFRDLTVQTSSGSGAVRVAPPQPTVHQVQPQVTPGLPSSSASAPASASGSAPASASGSVPASAQRPGRTAASSGP